MPVVNRTPAPPMHAAVARVPLQASVATFAALVLVTVPVVLVTVLVTVPVAVEVETAAPAGAKVRLGRLQRTTTAQVPVSPRQNRLRTPGHPVPRPDANLHVRRACVC